MVWLCVNMPILYSPRLNAFGDVVSSVGWLQLQRCCDHFMEACIVLQPLRCSRVICSSSSS
jgi:hypothetical protein